jgi:hypothetical protein
MSTLEKEMEPYKLGARRHRANMLKAIKSDDAPTAEKEFKFAINFIEEGFRFLSSYQAPDLTSQEDAGEGESNVAEQLADLWGIKGGVYRARGDETRDASGKNDFDRAVEAYDSGYQYESAPRFRILNSYATVNRLVLRILRDPALLQSDEPVPGIGLTMRDLLGRAATDIEHQLDKGRRDVAWALADIAMIDLLTGTDDVKEILNELSESTPTNPWPLESMLNVIRDLLRAGVGLHDRLVAAGEELRKKLPSAMKGPPL